MSPMNFTASDLVDQVGGFARNMSGLPEIDELVGPFMDALVASNTGKKCSAAFRRGTLVTGLVRVN
jgi:hypothetical protein